MLGAGIPLAIILWLVFSSESPERRSSESRAASQHAAAPVTGHKEIGVSDGAGLQASHHMPVIVTGTVARVVKNDLVGDGSSFALELYFAETTTSPCTSSQWPLPRSRRDSARTGWLGSGWRSDRIGSSRIPLRSS